MSYIIFLIFGVSINLFIISSPVIILLVILFNSMLTSLIIAFNLSSWYAFLIYLIYIGGILVIFSYFVAISPNQFLKIKLMIFLPVTVILLLISRYFMYRNYFSLNIFFFNFILILYKNESNFCIFFLILLLILIILIVSKIIKLAKGPLRPFIYVSPFTKK